MRWTSSVVSCYTTTTKNVKVVASPATFREGIIYLRPVLGEGSLAGPNSSHMITNGPNSEHVGTIRFTAADLRRAA